MAYSRKNQVIQYSRRNSVIWYYILYETWQTNSFIDKLDHDQSSENIFWVK